MSAKQFQGVVFDLDGTLYSLKGRKLRMTITLWRDINLLRHMTGARSWMRTRSYESRDDFLRAFYIELGRRARVSNARAASWYEDRFLASFVKMLREKAKVRPGLQDLLTRLRQRGVKLGVLSDFGHVAERLAALRIPAGAFDAAESAEDYGVLKPSPRPLTALADRWSMAPENVVVVGDRQDLDAASAWAAGMCFLGVSDGRPGQRGRDGFVSWTEAKQTLETGAGQAAEKNVQLDRSRSARHASERTLGKTGDCV